MVPRLFRRDGGQWSLLLMSTLSDVVIVVEGLENQTNINNKINQLCAPYIVFIWFDMVVDDFMRFLCAL